MRHAHGGGKSPASRRIATLLRDAGKRVALLRHPMPYGDLERMRVQRFATTADIDAAQPTIEEREEYEGPVELGIVVYAGVDYAAILDQAAAEADVIVWDGGNNDFPFFAPDLLIVMTDPLRAGDELRYHPGETNLRMADVVVINKVDRAWTDAVDTVLGHVQDVNPGAVVVRAASPVSLGPGPELRGRRVLVVEDGPTITHGGMPYGAGTVAAQRSHAGELVDPRPWAVGSIAETLRAVPAHRQRAPGDGLLTRSARRARAHDSRGRMRCGCDRNARRSRASHRHRTSVSTRHLRDA